MKKTFLTSVAVLVLVVVCFAALTACDKESDLTVLSYDITPSKVDIGDTFAAPTITANMSDETTKTVSKNLVYSASDLALLELDADKKFTKAGTFQVKVYILEEREEFLLGTWDITVRVKK